MKLYKVLVDTDDKFTYHPTKPEAHAHIKENIGKALWNEVRVVHIEIATDQKSIASILSGWGVAETVCRTWAVTPRGGLKEVPNGD